MARFIEGCVLIKENIIVAGGTGSGKTTLLNIVSSLIPDDERILTIEDSSELQLNQEHIVPFESRPADKFGKGEVNMGHLLHSALRLRPDRIVVGEVRGGEAFDLMQAMNTGHGGSMATTHANTPTDTLRRIESLCLMSGVELPMVAVRAQVASGIQVVITCERLQDGSRKTTTIAEVLPLSDKGDYRTQDIFCFTATHKDAEGKIHGYHAPTGIIPNFIGRLHAYGFQDMDEAFFDPDTYGVPPPPLFHADGVTTKWIKKLKHRQDGGHDDETQEKEWADARLQKGKDVERQMKEKDVAAEARKAADAAAKSSPPAEPKAAPEAPRPRAALPEPKAPVHTEPAKPALKPGMDALFDGVDTSSLTGARPIPQPPVGQVGTSPRMATRPGAPALGRSGSIEISPELHDDGEVSHEAPPEHDLDAAEDPVDDDAGPFDEQEDTPPPAPLRRPGPSAPRPSGMPVRAPGPRKPAPSRGFGAPPVADESDEEAPPTADRTVIKPPPRR
jgi:pilus assembly protein CpaF